jgi:hypothetical protein
MSGQKQEIVRVNNNTCRIAMKKHVLMMLEPTKKSIHDSCCDFFSNPTPNMEFIGIAVPDKANMLKL